MTTKEWLTVFRKSLPAYTKAAAADPAVPEARRGAAVEAFSAAFGGVLDALALDPTAAAVDGFTTQPINCSTLCRVRCELGCGCLSGCWCKCSSKTHAVKLCAGGAIS